MCRSGAARPGSRGCAQGPRATSLRQACAAAIPRVELQQAFGREARSGNRHVRRGVDADGLVDPYPAVRFSCTSAVDDASPKPTAREAEWDAWLPLGPPRGRRRHAIRRSDVRAESVDGTVATARLAWTAEGRADVHERVSPFGRAAIRHGGIGDGLDFCVL